MLWLQILLSHPPTTRRFSNETPPHTAAAVCGAQEACCYSILYTSIRVTWRKEKRSFFFYKSLFWTLNWSSREYRVTSFCGVIIGCSIYVTPLVLLQSNFTVSLLVGSRGAEREKNPICCLHAKLLKQGVSANCQDPLKSCWISGKRIQ